jgi:hypothetical protein
MSFETTPPGGPLASPNLADVSLGGLKALGYNIFLCHSERSDEAAPGLTFGPRIEGAAPESDNQVAIK